MVRQKVNSNVCTSFRAGKTVSVVVIDVAVHSVAARCTRDKAGKACQTLANPESSSSSSSLRACWERQRPHPSMKTPQTLAFYCATTTLADGRPPPSHRRGQKYRLAFVGRGFARNSPERAEASEKDGAGEAVRVSCYDFVALYEHAIHAIRCSSECLPSRIKNSLGFGSSIREELGVFRHCQAQPYLRFRLTTRLQHTG
jgi:hypothetical protein